MKITKKMVGRIVTRQRCLEKMPSQFWLIVYVGKNRMFSEHWVENKFLTEESNPLEDDWIFWKKPKKCKKCGQII